MLVVVVALAVGTGIGAVVVSPCPYLSFVALTFHFVCMSYHTPEKRTPTTSYEGCGDDPHLGLHIHRLTTPPFI